MSVPIGHDSAAGTRAESAVQSARKGRPSRFIMHLPDDLYAALRARAAADDRTLAGTVRRALRIYLDGDS